MYRGQYTHIDDFSGGIKNPQGIFSTTAAGNYSTNIPLNCASDADNIVVVEDGKGFRTRGGSLLLNGTALNGPVTGLSYYVKADGTDFAIAVAGTKLYRATSFAGAYSDITGALGITSGAAFLWDLFTFNDTTIGFGGQQLAPDNPIKCTDVGNGSVLGGSPPLAWGAFAANNRVFAFRTAASPSSIYWSTLGNAEDWTGTGSGSTVVGTANDNSEITAAAVADRNSAYIFKANNIYQLILTTAPFPVYLIKSGTGVGGKGCVCNIDGVIYFLSPYGELQAIKNGEIVTFPNEISNLGQNIIDFRRVKMFRQNGQDFDWLVISEGSNSNGYAYIWDLINECWLKCTTGYTGMTSCSSEINNQANAVRYYYGDKNGYIFWVGNTGSPDQVSSGGVATNTAISAYWQSIYRSQNPDRTTRIDRAILIHRASGSGSGTFSYSYSLDPATNTTTTFSLAPTATELIKKSIIPTIGRGDFFRYKISLSSATLQLQINEIWLAEKNNAAGKK